MSRRVVQIVPNLPPPHEGVGSFATALAAALSAGCGIESRFLVPSKDSLDEALADGGEGIPVLLHYANYGYEPRGCPSWLIDGLARWKARRRGRLVTLFHEFRASGPPWRSSFWLSPLQRRLATVLMRLSDGLATTLQLHERILLGWVPGREIAVLPVFSTVGEPVETAPLAARDRRLVVFGGPGTRALAYRELKPEISLACRTLGIEEILDIGPDDEPPASDLPVPVRRLGPLPDTEVSGLLAGSLAGFLGYPAPFLAKSTVFAAYCAHRMLPICAWPRPRRDTLPAELPPFWTPLPGEDLPSLQEIADRAHAWYGGHSLSRHAATYHDLLFP
ncbi:MAG TPA: glycosyltransferase family 1 protein [Thermoanaerobaculia bacterium]|jgi:hypothetical protein|nr:glycosyltransferase family 1 protein [Thermoanaerobaculia bacterium]